MVNGSSKTRFAYVRLKASECTSLKPKPNWLRLTSPYNDTGHKSIGMVMMNVRLIRFDPEKVFNPEREFVKSKEKATYKFYCSIL